jgi:hypothetical protein
MALIIILRRNRIAQSKTLINGVKDNDYKINNHCSMRTHEQMMKSHYIDNFVRSRWTGQPKPNWLFRFLQSLFS